MTKMTINGVTNTNAPGQEQYEKFTQFLGRVRRTYFSYDYRHTDGELFSCVKTTLKACRETRDAWLESKSVNN